jgi:hypothetical protein
MIGVKEPLKADRRKEHDAEYFSTGRKKKQVLRMYRNLRKLWRFLWKNSYLGLKRLKKFFS